MSAPLARAARSRAAQLSHALGVAAAVVIAVLGNVLAARHYARWDWTSTGLYSLSPATRQTLAALGEPVEIHVLLGDSEPLALTLRHVLEAYRAETGKLAVHFVDPDRRPAELIAVQQRYGIVAGKVEDGRVVTDANIVVARGEHHHFITASELVEVEGGEEARARPQVEEVLTAAIRQVVSGEKPRVCFTTGHGEPALERGGDDGLLALRERLLKQNFEAVELPAQAALTGPDPIRGCRLVVLAAPQQRVPRADVRRLGEYFEEGGNLLVVSGPVPDAQEEGYVDLGLGSLFGKLGLVQHQDFVFERDPAQRAAEGFGEIFMVGLEPHAITAGLLGAEGIAPVVLTVASSLAPLAGAAVKPDPLLRTSADSFGMVDFFAWAKHPVAPEPRPGDHRGPLTIAYAVELPRTDATRPHGPRAVAMASTSGIYGGNWSNRQLQGTALLVEAMLSWLASQPIALDIPAKPGHAVGLRISAEALKSTFVKVVVLLPLAVLALGVAVHLRRRATEARGRRRGEAARRARQGDDEESEG